MSYSKDLRERVIRFVQEGGSKVDAARVFKIGRGTVYLWLTNPIAKKTGPKASFKLDWSKVKSRVETSPDVFIKELAAEFNVSNTAIWYALKRLNLPRKKNVALR